MRAIGSWRRWALSFLFAGLASLAITAGASAATSVPYWGTALPYAATTSSSNETVVLGTSCTSVGNCAAVGETDIDVSGSDTSAPFLAAESGGTWGPPTSLALPGGDEGYLESISCTSATSCVAVGADQSADTPIIYPIAVSGLTATAQTPVAVTAPGPDALLSSVSCVSSGACTAVGSYMGGDLPMVAYTSGTGPWTVKAAGTSAPVAATSDSVLNAISCPSSGACEAVGEYADTSGNVYPWALTVTDGVLGTGTNVGLPGDAVPSDSSEIEEGSFTFNGLDAVSCPSAGVCTAAGSYSIASGSIEAVAIPIVNATPGTPVEFGAGSSASDVETTISGISCSDASDCSAVATTNYPFPSASVANENAGSWSALAPLTLPSNYLIAEATAISCPVAEFCVASGVEAALGGSTGETLSTFFANSAPVLSATTTSLPGATVGQPYSATLGATGGSGTDSFAVTAGSLPAGLSLAPATGVISGTPTGSGQDGFVTSVTSPNPTQTVTSSLSITVAPASATQTTPSTTTTPSPTTVTVTTPTPTPTPAVARVAITKLSISGAKAKITLSCSGAACAGALKLAGIEHLTGKTPTAIAALTTQKKITKAITLATGKYSLTAGQTKTVTLTLSAATVKLLTKLHTIHAQLTITPTGAKTAALTKTLTFKATVTKKKTKQT
jgi:hypothetical protein